MVLEVDEVSGTEIIFPVALVAGDLLSEMEKTIGWAPSTGDETQTRAAVGGTLLAPVISVEGRAVGMISVLAKVQEEVPEALDRTLRGRTHFGKTRGDVGAVDLVLGTA